MLPASTKYTVDTRVTVETPEGVDFQYVIAGPGKRGTAWLYDAIIRIAVLVVFAWILGLAGVFLGSARGQIIGLILVAWFVLAWLYGALFETFMHGQTPGKRSLGLRVLRTNGTPIGWFQAFGRNLLLVADGWVLFGPLGLNTVAILSMTVTRRMQRLGDLFFDTMVVDEERSRIGRVSGLTDDVERIPREQCTGRYHVPERTLAIAERLFEGDRVIPPLRREEIARPLANAIRARLGWQEPGPDLTNPHQFYEQTPFRHSMFLRRVLKTFAVDHSAGKERPAGHRAFDPTDSCSITEYDVPSSAIVSATAAAQASVATSSTTVQEDPASEVSS